jgi:hypothetical protein
MLLLVVVVPCCVRSVFLLFNIALGAYILGTITLLVVKNDERTGRYRDLSTNLKTYRWVQVKAHAVWELPAAGCLMISLCWPLPTRVPRNSEYTPGFAGALCLLK